MREEQSRPGLDTLADYLEGLLSEQESREVERWVAEDATTAELLRELEELPGLLLAADPVEPMPADVVDRVDAALAEAALVRGGAHDAPVEPARPAAAPRRNDQGAGGVVVPLRRRRWLAPALSAAAMVGVVALGAQVVGSVGTGDSSSPTSADDAAAGSDEAESAGGLTAREQTGNAPGYTAGMLPPVRTDTFATDVADALTDPTTDLQRVDGVDVGEAAGLPSTLLSGDCPVDLGAGRFLPIRLDGDVAVLVVRRIPGEPGRREALAYSPRCPDGDEEGDLQPLVRAEITLP